MAELTVQDPYTHQELGRVPYLNSREIESTVSSADKCFRRWKNSSAYERSQVLIAAAKNLEIRQEEFAQLIRQEAGKPITYARAEVKRAIGVLDWASAEALRYAGEILRLDASAQGRPGFGIAHRFPRGVVLGITPFNFPLNLVAHKVAPAIASGCSILIKPSPYTPLTALKFSQLFDSVPGLVQTMILDDNASAKLTQATEIKTISFTGSSQVGWIIKNQAPTKPITLELGGNAWVVVCEDTPRELFQKIAKRITQAAFGYAGQSCISVQNIAVAQPLFTEFAEYLREATRTTPFGDPSDENVISGPQIHLDASNRVMKQLSKLPHDLQKHSSSLFIGQDESRTFQVAPTLVELPNLDDPRRNEPSIRDQFNHLSNEEIFAPVTTLTDFKQNSDILELVNSSTYGLQTGVYTQNFATIDMLFRNLEIGGLVVNDVPTSRYDHQPYGGVKQSGQGREGIRYAMDEMTEAKFLALSPVIPL